MVINGIILSAGYSSRMGEFKPLALYKEKPFLENIIIKLNEVCEKIIIVTGYKKDFLKEEILKNKKITDKIVFVHNKNFDAGMFGSIQTGILKCGNCDWAIIHQVDQPGLPQKFYSAFINEIDTKHNWIQPGYNNRYGHPILINKSLFGLILKEKIESNLKIVSRNKMFIKKVWECSYKEILQDIDTEKDYRDLVKKRDTNI